MIGFSFEIEFPLHFCRQNAGTYFVMGSRFNICALVFRYGRALMMMGRILKTLYHIIGIIGALNLARSCELVVSRCLRWYYT